MEHKPVHVVGDIRQGELRLSPRQVDRANEQAVSGLLIGEDVLHPRAHARLLAVGAS